MRKLLIFAVSAVILASCGNAEHDMADNAIKSTLKSSSSYENISYSQLTPVNYNFEFDPEYDAERNLLLQAELLETENPGNKKAHDLRIRAVEHVDSVRSAAENQKRGQIGWVMDVKYSATNSYNARLDDSKAIYFSLDKSKCYTEIEDLYNK